MMKYVFVLIALFFLFTGCATPLPSHHAASLKSCEKTELKGVRTKLLKMGFTLTADEPKFLRTNFRAVPWSSHHYGVGSKYSFLFEKSQSGLKYKAFKSVSDSEPEFELPVTEDSQHVFEGAREYLCGIEETYP